MTIDPFQYVMNSVEIAALGGQFNRVMKALCVHSPHRGLFASPLRFETSHPTDCPRKPASISTFDSENVRSGFEGQNEEPASDLGASLGINRPSFAIPYQPIVTFGVIADIASMRFQQPACVARI